MTIKKKTPAMLDREVKSAAKGLCDIEKKIAGARRLIKKLTVAKKAAIKKLAAKKKAAGKKVIVKKTTKNKLPARPLRHTTVEFPSPGYGGHPAPSWSISPGRD